MAYYTALIAAWNSSIQPPTGVTGTGLSSNDTTAQKLAKVNAWTITGAIPTTVSLPSYQVACAVNYAEFKALTATQQSNLLQAFTATAGGFLGGSANTAYLPVGMLIDYFASSGQTIANLTALARALSQSWAQVNGYPYISSLGNLGPSDLIAAGGLT